MGRTLTVGSLNTHLFLGSPLAAQKGNVFKDEERRKAILGLMQDYDILSLIEVWGVSERAKIAKALPGHRVFAPEPDGTLDGYIGGPALVLAIRGDWLYGPKVAYYTTASGADKFAKKGVVFGVARVAGQVIGLVQTHTQATYVGSEKPTMAARDRQIRETLLPALDEVQTWLKRQSLEAPVLLMGDLNIIGESAEYKAVAAEFAARGFADCWPALHGSAPGYTYDPEANRLVKTWDASEHQKQRLDYFFLAEGGSGAGCRAMAVRDDWTFKPIGLPRLPVSDHYGIDATLDVP